MNHLIRYFYHRIHCILKTSEYTNHELLMMASRQIQMLMSEMYGYIYTLDDEQALNDGLVFNFKAMGAAYIEKNFPELKAEFYEERLAVQLK